MLIWAAPPNNQRTRSGTSQKKSRAIPTPSISVSRTGSGIFRPVPVPDSPVSLLLFPEPISGSVSASWSTASLICLKSLFVARRLVRECVSLLLLIPTWTFIFLCGRWHYNELCKSVKVHWFRFITFWVVICFSWFAEFIWWWRQHQQQQLGYDGLRASDCQVSEFDLYVLLLVMGRRNQ